MPKIKLQNEIIVICPHCSEPVIIEQLNCGIFRHGQYKHLDRQVSPHMPKDKCLKLLEEKKVDGCMGPFKVINHKEAEKEEWKAIICDYI
jgi:hypothetical protein